MPEYIYGRIPVISSLEERRVKKVFLSKTIKDDELVKKIRKLCPNLIEVENSELNQMVQGNHQGIVAEIIPYEYSSLEEIINEGKKKKYPLIVMLDEINDPQNLGAIIRNADAFNVDGILIKKHNQVGLNATVAKVSTGAINYVKVAQVTNLCSAIKTLKEQGYWIVSSAGNTKTDYTDIDYKMPIVLVIGNEGSGISRLVLENSDFIAKIPMFGHVDSLNASVATAVFISQIIASRK
jgi:23S rRNA (guanosine2251-2'-O)-methyltransferase